MAAPSEICQSSGGTIVPGNPCHLSPAAAGLPLVDWQYLINFRPPASVKSAVHQRFHQEAHDTPDYHPIEFGSGPINLDFYLVYIHQMPIIDGARLTSSDLITYFKKNLTSFMDTSKVTFGSYETEDYVKWQSDDSLGSVMHFHIGAQGESWLPFANPENLSVVASEIASDHWIFSPLWTPNDQNHCVSGNRQFGIGTRRVSDTYSPPHDIVFGDPPAADIPYVYMRGADRCTTPADWIMSNSIFAGGNDCWTGACNKLQQWVDNNGGRASIPGCISKRYDWDTIKAAYWQNPPI